jgi:hypothetical protein
MYALLIKQRFKYIIQVYVKIPKPIRISGITLCLSSWADIKMNLRVTLSGQGDDVGRIFAYWAIVYFSRLLKITEKANILGQLFPR